MRDQIKQMIQKQCSFKGLKKVEDEFLDHLEDAAESYIAEGYSKAEAIQMAITQFGDIKELKKEIENMNRTRNFLRFSMWTSLFLFLFSFALTFKMQWHVPAWMGDVNIFRVVKLVAFSFLVTTISFFAVYKKNKKSMMV